MPFAALKKTPLHQTWTLYGPQATSGPLNVHVQHAWITFILKTTAILFSIYVCACLHTYTPSQSFWFSPPQQFQFLMWPLGKINWSSLLCTFYPSNSALAILASNEGWIGPPRFKQEALAIIYLLIIFCAAHLTGKAALNSPPNVICNLMFRMQPILLSTIFQGTLFLLCCLLQYFWYDAAFCDCCWIR